MKLKVADPKTVGEVNKNLENLAEQVIGKDITKDVEALTQTSTETPDVGGADETLLTHIKTDIQNLMAQLNLLVSNIKDQ